MKLGNAFLGAVVLASGAFVVLACGGSSSSTSTSSPGNDGGGNGNPVTTGTDSGASQVDANSGVSCTGASGECASGEVCCQPLALSGATCVASGSCSGVTLSASCKGTSDCSGGDVCCLSISGGISTACAASCTGGQLCASVSDCPAGDSCQAVPATSYSICIGSLDGGFSFDASGFFDTGAPPQGDDAGIADAGPG